MSNYCKKCYELTEQLDQLKKQRQADKGLITSTGKMNYQLLQEYDQLKTENEKYALFIEKLCDYAGLECDSEEQAMRTLSDLASQMNKARWIIDRYKQTLTEIKEIAEVLITITDEYDNCYHKSECNKCLLGINGDCQYFKVEQILQKISEVEDG